MWIHDLLHNLSEPSIFPKILIYLAFSCFRNRYNKFVFFKCTSHGYKVFLIYGSSQYENFLPWGVKEKMSHLPIRRFLLFNVWMGHPFHNDDFDLWLSPSNSHLLSLKFRLFKFSTHFDKYKQPPPAKADKFYKSQQLLFHKILSLKPTQTHINITQTVD